MVVIINHHIVDASNALKLLFKSFLPVFQRRRIVKLNMTIFLSDRHLTAVVERCAGKQHPPVEHNRELDDVTHGAPRGNGAVTN